MTNRTVTIRDPIHGTMWVSPQERTVIDTRAVQRLRNVRQLGFADLAFPGATHSRYSHSLGAMHLAGKVAEMVFAKLPAADQAFLTQCVRLAALLHDVGHAPMSHTSERLMPSIKSLGLPAWACDEDKGQATHEDYTVLLLLKSELSTQIDQTFGPGTAKQVASIVAGKQEGPSQFKIGGVDYFPVLRQLVSSEIDVDRMDYLLRDSFYTGVNYGKYDLDWLVQNASCHVHQGAAHLAIGNRAIFAFEDFLLSRLHMFLAVYYHYIPVGFDHLMMRYAQEAAGEYIFPSDAEAYTLHDDVHFISALRGSDNPWAKRLAFRRGYRLLLEMTERDRPVHKEQVLAELKAKHIDAFETAASGVLSKYFGTGNTPIFVINESLEQVTPLNEYTPLFERYQASVVVTRVYVDPDRIDEARAISKKCLTKG